MFEYNKKLPYSLFQNNNNISFKIKILKKSIVPYCHNRLIYYSIIFTHTIKHPIRPRTSGVTQNPRKFGILTAKFCKI